VHAVNRLPILPEEGQSSMEMLLRSLGDLIELPEQGELVIAVIKKIMPYGAFCVLPEYSDTEGFLHISEVAPRWIKNIHEFISEGQRYVVKVHHVDQQKRQVDISIKRVSEEEKKRKLEMVQHEKKGKKLIELSLKASKLKLEAVKISEEIEKHYEDIYACFKEASISGEDALKDIDLPKALKKEMIELAKKSIKKSVVQVDRNFTLVCYSGNGIEVVKKALELGEDAKISYLGAPNYRISLIGPDYKTVEKKIDGILEHIKAFAQKNHCDCEYERR
jgi:translation initiation factor 2 subunit 1